MMTVPKTRLTTTNPKMISKVRDKSPDKGDHTGWIQMSVDTTESINRQFYRYKEDCFLCIQHKNGKKAGEDKETRHTAFIAAAREKQDGKADEKYDDNCNQIAHLIASALIGVIQQKYSHGARQKLTRPVTKSLPTSKQSTAIT